MQSASITSMTFNGSNRREAPKLLKHKVSRCKSYWTVCCGQIIIICAVALACKSNVSLKKGDLCKHNLSLFSPYFFSTCRSSRSEMSLITVVKQRFVFLCVSLVSKIISRTVYFGRLSGSRLIITICSTVNSLHPPHPHST